MSHEVVFLPHILGQTWGQALAAARTAAREEDPRIVAARLEPWPDLVLHAAQILGQIEEYRGRGQRELVHPVTRLRFTFFGEDGVIALPYWYDGPVARMAATMAFRFAHAVESDTGLAAYDPQQRTPLAEMGLEKFVAGYLRGREKALDQAAARGPVPVGHELPTGRSASRRELAAGPSNGGGSPARGGDRGRPTPDAGRSTDSRRRGGKPARSEELGGRGAQAAPRKAADQRPPADGGSPTSAGRLRRVEPPGRGQDAVRRDRDRDAAAGRGQESARRERDRDAAAAQRRPAQPMRGDDFGAGDSGARPAKSPARRPPADPAGQKPPRPRQNPDARGPEESGKSSGGGWLRRGSKAPRGEDPQRSRKPQRGTPPPPGSEWVPRPGSPERGVPPDPRAKRPERPAQGGRPDPRRAPRQQPGGPSSGQDPQGRGRPPELPKGH